MREILIEMVLHSIRYEFIYKNNRKLESQGKVVFQKVDSPQTNFVEISSARVDIGNASDT